MGEPPGALVAGVSCPEMRLRVVGTLLVLAACLVSSAAAATIDLRITVWPQGTSAGRSVSWSLRCGPAGGTLPRAARACRLLQTLHDPFAPVPPDEICSQIYGGPQVTVVRGTYLGRRVWAKFRRNDGCQTARWTRVAFLFPSA